MTDRANHHITPADMAAYVDGRLPQALHDDVVSHLSECSQCRGEFADAKRIVRSGARRGAVGAAIGLAAAATVLLVLIPGGLLPTRAVVDALRSDDAGHGLTVYGPLGSVSDAPRQLVWGTFGANTVYRVSLTAEDGSPVLRASTEDTVLIVPDSVRFVNDVVYRWWVDAVQLNGTTGSSGVREFRIEF